MGYPSKIVTCCYCGVRAALVMPKSGRHELVCSRCAAPLTDLKMLPRPKPMEAVSKPKNVKSYKTSTVVAKSRPVAKQRRKPKRRKSIMKDLFEEAFDFIEDIFD